jgi:hypothetical protein
LMAHRDEDRRFAKQCVRPCLLDPGRGAGWASKEMPEVESWGTDRRA